MLSDIFDGHMLRQLQGVTLKGMRVTETRISKTDLHLTHGATAMAANPWNGKHQGHGFATNGQSPKASFGLAAAHDLSGVTHGTTPLGGRLAQAEYDLPLHVLGALTLVATDTKGMVQQTCGHADTSLGVVATASSWPACLPFATKKYASPG